MFRLHKSNMNRTQYGQGIVEFALTIPVFLALVVGIIEFSRYFLIQSAIFTASREATRYGSSVGEGGLPNYKNCEQIAETAVRMGSFGGIQYDDISIYYESSPGVWVADCNPGVEPANRYNPILGDRVVVEINTEFRSLVGIVPDVNIHSSNGRTIMLGVSKYAAAIMTGEPAAGPNPTATLTTTATIMSTSTGVPIETSTMEPATPIAPTYTEAPPTTATQDPTQIVCPGNPVFLIETTSPNSNTVSFTLGNTSEYGFKISEIANINYSKGDLISVQNKPPDGSPPNQSVTGVNVPIPAGSTATIDFVFQNKHHEDLSYVFHFELYGVEESECSASLSYP